MNITDIETFHCSDGKHNNIFLQVHTDVCICGGLMEMRKIAAIAEGHDVMVAPHNPMGPIATAINVHFAAATYNFSILEFVPHDED